jgi:uncharacterized protein YceK
MTINQIMRASALTVLLAATAAVQGCSSVPSQQSMMQANTGVYSANSWNAELDTYMTSTSGGE